MIINGLFHQLPANLQGQILIIEINVPLPGKGINGITVQFIYPANQRRIGRLWVDVLQCSIDYLCYFSYVFILQEVFRHNVQ